jgi:hypothetical protein
MKRALVALVLLSFAYQISCSQEIWKRKRYELTAGFGTSHFFGDIGGYSQNENAFGLKDIITYQTRFNVNTGLRYRIVPSISVRLNLTYAMFHATDEMGSNEERGMEATTSAFETAIIGEYYFLKSKKDNSYLYSTGRKSKFKKVIESLDIFAFTGIGGLAYSVNGNDVLESENMPDGGFTAVIPIGLGVNTVVSPYYSLGIELGRRSTFSDYLDGYTSQYSNSNDVYYFLSFTFNYKIPTSYKGKPLFTGRRRY